MTKTFEQQRREREQRARHALKVYAKQCLPHAAAYNLDRLALNLLAAVDNQLFNTDLAGYELENTQP